MVKNGFPLSRVVAVGAKGCVWDAVATVWAIASDVRDVTAAMWAVIASLCDVTVALWTSMQWLRCRGSVNCLFVGIFQKNDRSNTEHAFAARSYPEQYGKLF